jgi:hypothetical protein
LGFSTAIPVQVRAKLVPNVKRETIERILEVVEGGDPSGGTQL